MALLAAVGDGAYRSIEEACQATIHVVQQPHRRSLKPRDTIKPFPFINVCMETYAPLFKPFAISARNGSLHDPFFRGRCLSFRPFSGNPAAICLLECLRPTLGCNRWHRRSTSQKPPLFIEPPPAFTCAGSRQLVKSTSVVMQLWPQSHVLWQEGWAQPNEIITFQTRSGPLKASRNEEQHIVLDFPQEPAEKVTRPTGFERALGLKRPPIAILKNRMDWLVHVDGPEELRSLQPKLDRNWPSSAAEAGSHLQFRSSRIRFLEPFLRPGRRIAEDPCNWLSPLLLGGLLVRHSQQDEDGWVSSLASRWGRWRRPLWRTNAAVRTSQYGRLGALPKPRTDSSQLIRSRIRLYA